MTQPQKTRIHKIDFEFFIFINFFKKYVEVLMF